MTRAPDAQSLIARLRLVQRGRERGKMNDPPVTQPGPDAVETEVVSECDRRFQDECDAYRRQRAVLEQRVASSVDPKSDADPGARANEACNAMKRMIAGERHELERLARTAQESIEEVKTFKKDHHLERPARLPENLALSIGVLAALVVVETIVNGLFFGANLEGGLFGGLTYAALISVINVGVFGLLASLFGRQFLHAGQLRRFSGLLVVPVAAGAFGWNLAVAHYREALAPDFPPSPAAVVQEEGASGGPAANAASPSQDERESCWRGDDEAAADGEAICLLRAQPFGLRGFQSYMLLLIGLAVCGLAAWDWWRMTDPYPGYGKVERARRKAEQDVLDEEREMLDQLADQHDEAVVRQRKEFADPTDLWKRGQEAIVELRGLHEALAVFSGELQRVCRQAVETYRAENRAARSRPEPEAWTVPANASWEMPEAPSPANIGGEAEAARRSQAAKAELERRIQALQACFEQCQAEVVRAARLHHD